MHADVLLCGVMVTTLLVLLSYVWGKRVGFRRGYTRAALEAPLRLRAEALGRGSCPVCDDSKPAWYNVPKEVVE